VCRLHNQRLRAEVLELLIEFQHCLLDKKGDDFGRNQIGIHTRSAVDQNIATVSGSGVLFIYKET